MQKKVGRLLVSFVVFYGFVHLSRHLPHLLHGQYDIGGEPTWMASVIRVTADMAVAFLFVLLSYLTLHRFYPRNNFAMILVWLLISLLATLAMGYCIASLFEQEHVPVGDYFSTSLFANTVDLVFGIVFYFLQYSRFKEVHEKELLLQTRQSELSFLRSQLNPHFLFNQLNNIYALVADHSDMSLNAISNLSDLLRYMLYDMDKMVPLELEISYINKYIALQQLKYERPVQIGFIITGNITTKVIHPLLLIPFIENAFKHGQLSTESEQLTIRLTAQQSQISFSCKNIKCGGVKDGSGGIGIPNVKRRLDLLYPDKYDLQIIDGDIDYTVELKLVYE